MLRKQVKLAFQWFFCALSLLLVTSNGIAQQYPSKPIRIVVGFPPGGLTDVYARLFASHLQTRLGQPVIVENKSGAATVIATLAVTRAEPDGYTLCFCVSNVMTNQFSREQLPYKVDDLVPVALGFRSATVLIVPQDSSFKDTRELVAYAKANPGKLNYATTGAGGATHIAGELFASVSGIKVTPIHYKGAAPANVALSAKEVDFAFSNIATGRPLLEGKRARAFAVAGEERAPAIADVPTMAEVGFPGVATSVWYGLMAPKGTPSVIIELLNREMNLFFGSESVRQRLFADGQTPMGRGTPAEMADYIAKDTELLRTIIVPLNLKLD